MNKCKLDILNYLASSPYENQRILAEQTDYSIGAVNSALKALREEGLLSADHRITEKAEKLFQKNSPKNAVILAAGYGMRMVPINVESPKAFVELFGEVLIERLIRQLQEAGIRDIYIVVGFMKESFDHLIDQFGVKLIVNPLYASKNNLHSLLLAEKLLGNTYIIPSDIRCENNPFSSRELYSWYLLSDRKTEESNVRINRKNEPTLIEAKEKGNGMIGISYLTEEDAKNVKQKLKKFSKMKEYDNAFWEETLFDDDRMTVSARLVSSDKVVEINTFEQLREIDNGSKNLNAQAITIAANALGTTPNKICDIRILKKGMTNRSFIFRFGDDRFIMRIPGEGTDKLINRSEEAAVYTILDGKNICDDVIYINPENGYKITRFLKNTRVCDAEDPKDVKKAMAFLRAFHEKDLSVSHEFDLFEKIQFYEDLWNGAPSAYRDYAETKKNILSLKPFLEENKLPYRLTHIDAVPDNFLFCENDEIRLIDWEYAAMQDPHVDIAMFAIYSLYEKEKIDALIDAYFIEGASPVIRKKIYAYIAVCGLLWSNWCEYKRLLGVEFGEYSLRQYRYAKDFYKFVNNFS